MPPPNGKASEMRRAKQIEPSRCWWKSTITVILPCSSRLPHHAVSPFLSFYVHIHKNTRMGRLARDSRQTVQTISECTTCWAVLGTWCTGHSKSCKPYATGAALCFQKRQVNRELNSVWKGLCLSWRSSFHPCSGRDSAWKIWRTARSQQQGGIRISPLAVGSY